MADDQSSNRFMEAKDHIGSNASGSAWPSEWTSLDNYRTTDERRASTRSEVVISQLSPVKGRPRSATTSTNVITNRWLNVDVISASHSESMCEINSMVTIKDSIPEKDAKVAASKKVRKSLVANIHQWKADAEPRTAWLLLFFCVIPVNILVGIEFVTFGIYYVEYVAYFEVPSATAGFIFTVRAAWISVFSVVTGSIIKRFSARSICICGGAFFFLSQLLGSFAPNVYLLFFTNGILIGMGNNLVFMTTNVLIQEHFTVNRGFGGSCSTIGYSIGHLAGPLLMTSVIEKYGWRGAMLIMAPVYANIIVFGAFYNPPSRLSASKEKTCNHSLKFRQTSSDNTPQIPRPRLDKETTVNERTIDKEINHGSPEDENTAEECLLKEDEDNVDKTESIKRVRNEGDTKRDEAKDTHPRQKADSKIKSFILDLFDFNLFKDYRFVVFCLSSVACRYSMSTFLHHMPRKIVTLGLPESVAFLMSIFGISVICCRILVSLVANLKFVDRLLLYGIGIVTGGVSNYITVVHSITGLAVASLVQGIHIALTNTLVFVVLVDMLGIKKLPKAMGLFGLTVSSGGMLAVPLSGRIYDVTYNYDTPFILAGTVAMAGGLAIFILVIITKSGRRRKSMNKAEKDVLNDKI